MIYKKEMKTNITVTGYYRVKIQYNIQPRVIKEIIRIEDASQ